jgi:hypothetical protein
VDSAIEVRYAGVAVGRATQVRDWTATGAFIGFAEPLPTGTRVELRGDGVRQVARVEDVIESVDVAVTGMRVRFVAEQAAEPAVAAPEPVVTAPEPAVTAPEPAVTAPEPAVTAPEPVVTAPEPTPAAAEPAAAAAAESPVPDPAEAHPPESGESGPNAGAGGGKRRRRRR